MGCKGSGALTADETAGAVELWQRVSRHLFATRIRADLYQRQVARRMGTTTSGVSRLENGLGHPPGLVTLYKYARAVGCRVEVRLVPIDWREDMEESGTQEI